MEELRLIYRVGMRAFPPRRAEQSIFYPVLTPAYAEQIARDWNSRSDPHAGYVTRFEVDDQYIARFEPKTVGARRHTELWVPSEELSTFNGHIAGLIAVAAAYFGSAFRGSVPDSFMLRGRTATEQLAALSEILAYNGMDFFLEISANSEAVYLNYPFWRQGRVPESILSAERQAELLDALGKAWAMQFPSLPLPELAGVAA